MGNTTARSKRIRVALLTAGLATVGIFGLSACDMPAPHTDAATDSKPRYSDPVEQSLADRGFTEIKSIGKAIIGHDHNLDHEGTKTTYSAKIGDCYATVVITVDSVDTSGIKATINNETIDGPTEAMIRADSRFAPCFEEPLTNINDNLKALVKAGFTQINDVDHSPSGHVFVYSAKMGTCGVTVTMTTGENDSNKNGVTATINDVKIDGPTKPLLMADLRFAPCFVGSTSVNIPPGPAPTPFYNPPSAPNPSIVFNGHS